MDRKYIPWIASLLIILGLVSVFLTARKKISVVIEGDEYTRVSYALTVGGFLRQQGIQVSQQDKISPPAGHMLWGNETITIQRASQAAVQHGKSISKVVTYDRIPANILAALDVPLYPKDQVLFQGEEVDPQSPLPYHPHLALELKRATPITLNMGGDLISFTTISDTLGKALWLENIPLYEGDQLSHSLSLPLNGEPLQVEMSRSQPLRVKLPGKTLSTRTTAERIDAALSEAGLALQGRDYTKPAEDQSIPENREVEIIRVQEEVIIEQEPIPFTNTYQALSDLEIDQRKIVEGGEYGLSAKRVRVIYENGRETSRITEKEWTAKEPRPRVIGYGTDIVVRTADTTDGQIRYWRKITAYATSYDETCPGCNKWTASGTRLEKGTVAVTLEWYRYMKGAKVYIPGYGFGTIEDVGTGIPGKYWVDLGYRHENYKHWSQNVTVYFLAPPPPPQNIMYVLY